MTLECTSFPAASRTHQWVNLGGGGACNLTIQGWIGHITRCGLPPVTRSSTSLKINHAPIPTDSVLQLLMERPLPGLAA